MVGLDTLMGSSRFILVGLATLTGSSRLILVGLATLTGSSRLTIFNLSYYTNITSTVTFVNHLMLCRAFLFFSPKYHPHKSGIILYIDLYVFNFLTEVSNSTNKLNHVKRLAVF